MTLSRTMKIDLLWALFGGIFTVLVLYACQGCKTSPPADAGITEVEAGQAVVTDACTLLTGVTQNQTVIAVCATIEEIAQVVALIATLRTADGGHPPLSAESLTCFPVPNNKLFCATPQEIGIGVTALLDARKARLTRDR